MSSAPPMPLPRLADHFDTAESPSDEEGEKDVKRQRSEPTTPIPTSSTPPREYDEVMESLTYPGRLTVRMRQEGQHDREVVQHP